MQADVLNISGEKTGRSVELPETVFGNEPNDHVVYLDVKRFLATKHTGNHKSKERAEIKGSTKKLRRQKGSGAARVGNIKSPIFKGGGTVFGPRKRSYEIKINKKTSALARKCVISDKVRNESLYVLEDFTFEQPKTKQAVEVMNSLSIGDKKVLFVTDQENRNVDLSVRNLPNAKVLYAHNVNTYNLMKYNVIVFNESGLDKFIERHS